MHSLNVTWIGLENKLGLPEADLLADHPAVGVRPLVVTDRAPLAAVVDLYPTFVHGAAPTDTDVQPAPCLPHTT